MNPGPDGPADATAGAGTERPGPPSGWHVLLEIPLRRRVAILVSVGAGLLVALIAVAVFLTAYRALYDQLDESLVERATAAASSDLADPSLLYRAVSSDALAAGDFRVAIVLADGRALSIQGSVPPIGSPEVAVASGTPQPPRTGIVGGAPYRVVAVQAGTGRALVLAQELEPTRRTLSRLAIVLVVVGSIGVVLAALVGVAIARAGLRPVERLISATERVARTGDLQPITVTGGDEIARLTRSFNAMLAALASSIDRQRRLVADAGHELRTPLTSLRTNLELLVAAEEGAASGRPDAPRLSPEDRTELTDDLRAQIDELATLVGDVVELARDDPPEVAAEHLDLSEVVERALDRARPRAPGVTFAAELAPLEVVGDASALERAVLNLLDNAAKWSPPGATVTVVLREGMAPERPGTAVLEIADEGPGIAPEERELVFDRFFRSADARTMPGSGLGLSIVAQTATRHHGGVAAHEAPSGGALLRLWLPRA
ncbi:HAMP domain-containing sensor histidine kinase [Actinomycetospora soli]|uniref:HAMP domain-containing sensor histidine kinase n=1 Tax=Actinomycetospora soli TaxID=2893887 RepID=UPI001E65951D|nr:HAMP domain-containing sensor histidine kinase [Actinomycetospora soli]MCD2189050.1 HAMP domain-containing histidine kinase [Actinomycetospora soli]